MIFGLSKYKEIDFICLLSVSIAREDRTHIVMKCVLIISENSWNGNEKKQKLNENFVLKM